MRSGRHFLYNLAGAGLPLLLAVVAVPMLGRNAGYERLGFLTIAWAVIGYLGFLDFGLSRVFARRVAVAHAAGRLAEETEFLRWIARRLLVFCILVALALAVLVPPRWIAGAQADALWLTEIRWGWAVLVSSLPALVLSNLWRGTMEGRQAFGVVNLIRLFMGACTFGAPLLVLLFTNALPALVGGIVLGRWIALGMQLAWCRAQLPVFSPREGRNGLDYVALSDRAAALRATLREGAWITVSGVIGPMMVVFDRFVLGSMAALATVAVYAIPQEIVLRLMVVPGMLAATLYPRMAVLAQGDQGDASRLTDRAARVAVVLQFPLCAAASITAQPLLALWLDPGFAQQAAPILRVLAVGCMANASAQLAFAHLQAGGRAALTARIHLLELLPYALGLWCAVDRFGALGAAWVWTLRCAVDALCMIAAVRRGHGDAGVPRLLLTWTVSCTALLLLALAQGDATRPDAAIIALAVAAIALVAGIGLDRDDRAALRAAGRLRGGTPG